MTVSDSRWWSPEAKIAHELVDQIKKNITIDWTVKENVKAKMRVMVKRILIKYNYPSDKQPKAVATILEQAEILCAEISKAEYINYEMLDKF